jgi:hypothetical protein
VTSQKFLDWLPNKQMHSNKEIHICVSIEKLECYAAVGLFSYTLLDFLNLLCQQVFPGDRAEFCRVSLSWHPLIGNI